jgi:hypothetical protein
MIFETDVSHRADGGKQRSENRRQRTDGRKQTAENRRQKTDDREQTTEDRDQRLEVSGFGFQVFRLRRTAGLNNCRFDRWKKLMNVESA